MPRHLVTGATGFVGSSLVLELLQLPDTRVTCLVRGDTTADASARLFAQLHRAAGDHGLESTPDLDSLVDVVVGDIGDPDLGAVAADVGSIDEAWHCAASLKYRDADVEEIRRTNVDGTRHVLALAEKAGATAFNYISTAYVAGQTSGLIPEAPVPADHPTHNQYERSKIDAEQLVLDTTSMHIRIFRPSIVIGHSRTFAADSSVGVFGFLREMSRFARTPRELPAIKLLAHPDTTLNFIPVDLVTSTAVEIAAKNLDDTVFHLTNGTPATVGDAIPIAASMLGLPAPIFTDDPDDLTRLDRRLNRLLDFYLPYIGGNRHFDRTNTDAVVGDRLDYPLPPVVIERLVQPWLDQHAADEPDD